MYPEKKAEQLSDVPGAYNSEEELRRDLGEELSQVDQFLLRHVRIPESHEESLRTLRAELLQRLAHPVGTTQSHPGQLPQPPFDTAALPQDQERVQTRLASPRIIPPTNLWEWARTELWLRLLDEKQDEVDKICARLRRDDVRLLTLTGPPGIGKTRLALEAAVTLWRNSSHLFPDGVFFVTLATTPVKARNPRLVVPTLIAKTLRVSNAEAVDETSSYDVKKLMRRLKSYLENKRMLLLLDRFDRVPGAEAVVSRLIKGTKYLKVLVTKLEPLGVEDEINFPIQPLTVPGGARSRSESLADFLRYGSVRLFSNEMKARDPDFAVTPANRGFVAKICQLLGGSPLAIQLVAAHSGHRSLQATLQQLRESNPIFVAGVARNGEQDTRDPAAVLKGVLDWSYNQLGPKYQALYRGLGIFWGGRTLESIAAVCNPAGDLSLWDLRVMVESLVEMKLLQVYEGVPPHSGARGEQRYWMREPIHEHALEQLDMSGEFEEYRKRHADYYLAFVENARSHIERPSGQQGEWRVRLRNELENIRKAMRMAKEKSDEAREWQLSQAMVWVLGESQQGGANKNKKLLLAQMQHISEALQVINRVEADVEDLSDKQKQVIQSQVHIIDAALQSITAVMSETNTLEESLMFRVVGRDVA